MHKTEHSRGATSQKGHTTSDSVGFDADDSVVDPTLREGHSESRVSFISISAVSGLSYCEHRALLDHQLGRSRSARDTTDPASIDRMRKELVKGNCSSRAERARNADLASGSVITTIWEWLTRAVHYFTRRFFNRPRP